MVRRIRAEASKNALVVIAMVVIVRELEVRFAPDSPLEEGGFEPSVPPKPDNGFRDCSVRFLRAHIIPHCPDEAATLSAFCSIMV
jgi:hypothetical protein